MTPETIREALKSRYKTGGTEPNVSQTDLIAFFRQIEEDTSGVTTSMTQVVADANPDWVLKAEDQAVLKSIDDCTRLIARLMDVETEISSILSTALPELACQLLEKPELPITKPPTSILTVLDKLVTAGVGWAPGLGRAGDQLTKKMSEVLGVIRSAESAYQDIDNDLSAFLEKEQGRIQKLEERLVASETGLLRSKKSNLATAQMINKAMYGKSLPITISEFLKGPWYDSIQYLALTKGFDSEEWFRATKMTETIIWTFQPIDSEDEEVVSKERQRLYRIIEHLPKEIHELLVALEHDTNQAESALEDIENEHVLVVSGQPLLYEDFSLIETGEDDGVSAAPAVSRILLKKVNNLQPGQWFTYQEDDVSLRIKLVLKLEDIKQLLFTNRNGMKALEKSFEELAYYLSSGVIKLLNHDAVFSSTFESFYLGAVEELERKQEEAKEERAEEVRQEAEREAAKERAINEAKALARQKEEQERERKEAEQAERMARAKQAAEQNQDKVPEISSAVAALNTGAWLKLPGADGVMEDSKLAVKLADKMIFVSSSGVKMGDYTTEELVQLIIAGEAVIADGGVEFEDTLAQVVTKLRQDRNKSYDDLTGTSD